MGSDTQGYSFVEIANCNMCGAVTTENYILGQRLNKPQGFRPKNKQGISVSVIKCKTCGLIYANPLPIPANIQDHYGIPPEEYWTYAKSEINSCYFSEQIQKAKRLLGSDTDGLKALDIGAGEGKSMNALNLAGFDTYGLEASATFRKFAIDSFGLDPERLKLGMIENAVYPDSFFDFITFGAVLEHFYNPADCISKAIKWLKPGGIIQIEVPSSNHLIAKIVNFYYRMVGTNYVTNLSPMHSPFHLYEFDLKSFAKNSKIQNYDIAEYYYYVCRIYHFPDFMHPLLRYIMAKRNSGMQLEVWLKKR